MLPPERDLFGKPLRQPRRSKYEVGLERFDRATRTERARRMKWVDKALPRGLSMMCPYETMLVFREAKDCYIAGHLAAALILAAAFMEHWLAALISARGFPSEARRGLAATVECARKNALLPESVLRKLDRLREIRNPFVHLKPMDHEHIVSRRMLRARVPTEELMDQDAREALSLMFTIGLYASPGG
jgi:hypothetical protein